jgi:hypothetical protein
MDLSGYENQQVETESVATAEIFFGQSAGILVIAVSAPASKQASRATIQHMLTYMVTTTCLHGKKERTKARKKQRTKVKRKEIPQYRPKKDRIKNPDRKRKQRNKER